MGYTALYRKWRPRRFADLVGQQHIARTLQNALRTGRISHAYLFSGPRGTGKTSTAKVLAKALNCSGFQDAEPCNQCVSCENINAGREELADVIEIDAASNRGIDEIRELRENVKLSPLARYKVYIIDEVHMLTTEAFNALLKTLEEPPDHVVFILATTEPHKLPATILSRCQRFDFKKIGVKEIVRRLQFVSEEEQIPVEQEALFKIARKAGGGMRDALSFLDQCASFAAGKVTENDVDFLLGTVGEEALFSLLQAVAENNPPEFFAGLEEAITTGRNLGQLAQDLQRYLRNLLVYRESPALVLEEVSEAEIQHLAKLSGSFSREDLLLGIQLLGEAEVQMKWAAEPRIFLEAALLRLCKGTEAVSYSHLVQQVKKLEERLSLLEQGRIPPTGKPAQEIKKESIRLEQEGVHPTSREDPPSAAEIPAAKGEKEPASRFAEIQSEWEKIVNACDMMLRIFLRQAVPVRLQGERLLLETANTAAQDTINEQREQIEKALKDVLNLSLTVTCQAKQEKKEAPGRKRTKDILEEPLVQAAIRMFDGEIVENDSEKEED